MDESALREREHPVKQKCIILIRYPIVPVKIVCFQYIHMSGDLHPSFFGSTFKHTAQKMYKPWIYEREAGAVNGPRFKKKTWNQKREKGSTRVEPLNTGDLFSSDKTHVTLTLQRPSLDAGFSLSLFPHPRCVIMSPSCEKCLALKLPSTKYMKKNSPGVWQRKRRYITSKTKKVFKSRWTNTLYISVIRPTLQN